LLNKKKEIKEKKNAKLPFQKANKGPLSIRKMTKIKTLNSMTLVLNKIKMISKKDKKLMKLQFGMIVRKRNTRPLRLS
jgi:hypothetical protein